MTEQPSAKPPARLFYLDNLRVYLTILVILHHTAMAYSGAGDWAIVDPAIDDISPIFLTFFTVVNQSGFRIENLWVAPLALAKSLFQPHAAGVRR